MSALLHVEVWTDFQCASGSRTAIILPSQIRSLVTTERTTRDDDGSLVLDRQAPGVSSLTDSSVLRLQFADASFREYRVHLTNDGNNGAPVSMSLRSPLLELETAGVLYETTALVSTVGLEWKALSPATVVSQILAFCPAWWTAGTITPTIPVDLQPAGWTPLQALRELISAIRGQGVACELDFRRNGTTGYYIDIVTAIGSSATALDVRVAKNLKSLTREVNRDRHAVAVTPLGTSNATCGKMWFEVTGKASSTLTVQQPVTGGEVVAFSGQLDGYYAVDDAGARQAISNSNVGDTFDVASATNFTVGRWYRLAKDSAGTDLITVEQTPGTARPHRIVTSSSLDGTTNFIQNPAMRVWTGGSSVPPDGWSLAGGAATLTLTTTAGLWVFGGQSLRIQNTTSTNLRTPATTVYVPAWATAATYSVWVYLVNTTGIPSAKFYRAGIERHSVDLTSGYALATWHRIDWTETLTPGSAQSFQVGVNYDGGGGEMYFDSGQVTFDGTAMPFTEGSSAARLRALANRYLDVYGTVPVSYSADFADLGAWDASQFPYDAAEVGQTATVTETDLGVSTSARIHELQRNWLDPDRSRLTINNRPDDLATILSGIGGSALTGTRRWTG